MEDAASSKTQPHGGAMKQQQLPAWTPAFSRDYVSFALLVVCIAMIPSGVCVLIAASNTPEIEIQYTQHQNCRYENQTRVLDPSGSGYLVPSGCPPLEISFEVTEKMLRPVTIYYKLTDFYQSYRRYAKSRSDRQLARLSGVDDLANCAPFETMDDGRFTIHPCGAIAWSMFNDSFRLYKKVVVDDPKKTTTKKELLCDSSAFNSTTNDRVGVNLNTLCRKKGIAWGSDIDKKFSAAPTSDPDVVTHAGIVAGGKHYNSSSIFSRQGWYMNEAGHAIPDPLDEDLMVWMSIAATPRFRKPFRFLDADLEPGSYLLEVVQRYPTSVFGGTKALVITSEGWLGPRDKTTGIGFIVIGVACLVWVCVLGSQQYATRDRMFNTGPPNFEIELE